MCGLTAVFGSLTQLPGFTTDDYINFILPVGFLQGAAFTGAATGVNLARDIELGWFDRLLASPAPRGVLLAGTVLSASLRVLMPITLLMIVGLALGVSFPGVDGLLLALFLAACFAAVAACYGVIIAMRFKTQAAAPLMQAGVFMAVLFTTSYAPQALLTGWLHDVAKLQPGDADPGGGAPGLRRRRDVGRHVARARRAGGARGRLRDASRCGRCAAPAHSAEAAPAPGSNMARMPPLADLIDLDTLHLRPGEGRRVDTEVRIEPLQLGGQRYAVDGGTVDTRLDVSRTVSGGYALRLRFDAPLEGACMRCMADAMPVIGVDAREIEQPGDAEELHSPYLDGGVARPRGLGARRAACSRCRPRSSAARTAWACAPCAART